VGVHRGTWSEGVIHWDSRFGLQHDEELLELATPLPAEVELTGGTSGVDALRDDAGRIYAFTIPSDTSSLRVALRQPWSGEVARLGAPLAAGDFVQRVVVDEAKLVPSGLGLQKHIRYWAPPGIDADARRLADRFADGRNAYGREQPVYLVADARLHEAGGLSGYVGPKRQISAGFPMLLGGTFIGFMGLCLWGFRKLDGEARAEQNALYIEQLGDDLVSPS
jgi:hypothetical protein